jgi:hypothetical protein
MLFIEIIAVCFVNDGGYTVAAALQTFKCARIFTVILLTVYWKASNYWKQISDLCVVCCSTKNCWTLCAVCMGTTRRVFHAAAHVIQLSLEESTFCMI